MTTCTDFCERLKSINVNELGALPSHDTLIKLLGFEEVDKGQGRLLGKLQYVQERSNFCGFCQLVTAAVRRSVRPENLEGIDPDQPISVLLFPGEQSFRLSFPSRLGLRLSFIASEPELVNAPDVARIVNTAGIEVDKIKGWLKTCVECHKACALEPIEDAKHTPEKINQIQQHTKRFREGATSNFRVLDLELGCIIKAALDSRYVTLSYVWGNLPMFSLRKDNFVFMSTPGSLDSIRKDLPKTLNDAIDLVKMLGERCLWIDGLCLVQDDANDVDLGVEMMNSIYHGSLCTIVAGSGTDANAGLPGFGENPRSTGVGQFVAKITTNLQMTFSHSIDWHLSRSWYNHRGWTLQELVLPRRTAIFINGQIYFRCREANWSEELWSDKFTQHLDSDDSNIMRLPDPSDGFMPSCWAYQKICEDYSKRTLRRDGDAIRALAGLIRPLAAGMETGLIDGLPGYYIDHFLLFISSNGKMRRRPEFGSFSWAGWEGSIMFPRENFVWFDQEGNRTWDTTDILRYLKYHSLVQWRYLDESASSEHLTSLWNEEPSPLLELLKEHPQIFTNVEKSAERDLLDRTWCQGSSSHGDIPHWYRSLVPEVNFGIEIPESLKNGDNDDGDNLDSKDIKKKLGPRSAFSIKGLDLANGGAEFARLVQKIDNVYEQMALRNWMAMRSFRVNAAERNKTARGPANVENDDGETSNYSFRQPYGEEERQQRSINRTKDERANTHQVIKRQRAATAKEEVTSQDEETETGKFEIPVFPPYGVLHFVTVSLTLALGHGSRLRQRQQQRQQQHRQEENSPFHRIPGIPLLSRTGKVVGSLHPDNEEETLSLPTKSKIELIVISRCNTATTGSALLSSSSSSTTAPSNQEIRRFENENENKNEDETPWKLLWVLHVIQRDGIHERRGVGQIQQSALEEEEEEEEEEKKTFDPKPALKSILLG